jgi:hypothetical protein
VTSEAARVVIVDTSLTKVDELLALERPPATGGARERVGGMALSVVGMAFAAGGRAAAGGRRRGAGIASSLMTHCVRARRRLTIRDGGRVGGRRG